MLRYDNQVVLITGAAGSIGRQLALQFARRGAYLALTDLEAEPLHQLNSELKLVNGNIKSAFAPADITQRDAMRTAIDQLQAELGPVDVVIANAGIALNNPIKGFCSSTFSKQVTVNLIGTAHTIEPLLSGMMARRRGHIVALSSLASYRGLPHMAGYCASKAGVSAFMDSLRVELKAYNIHCTTICPSYIRSRMNAMLGVPTPGIMTAEEAVRRMMPGIERKRPYIAFPFVNHFLLAISQLFPTWLADYLTLAKTGEVLKEGFQQNRESEDANRPQQERLGR